MCGKESTVLYSQLSEAKTYMYPKVLAKLALLLKNFMLAPLQKQGGYPGCIQTGETVIMRVLLQY